MKVLSGILVVLEMWLPLKRRQLSFALDSRLSKTRFKITTYSLQSSLIFDLAFYQRIYETRRSKTTGLGKSFFVRT